MIRVKIFSLLILMFAIFLSSCTLGAQDTRNPDLTSLQGTDTAQQLATFVSIGLTQTAEAGMPATVTPVAGPTLPEEATLAPTPGGVILPAPTLIPYQTLFQSPSLGIQFSYPSAWYRRESNDGVTLTSFDPSNPPHKLEWTEQTVSMQFGYKVFTTPLDFDAWVESARQTALANGLSIYEEERFQLLFANQIAAHLTLVSGSGGVIHQVLTNVNGRYLEIFIEGNFNLAHAVLDSMQSSSEGVIKQPDSDTPAAGICMEGPGDPVDIVLGLDASGMPLAGRCITINPVQRIKLINQSGNPIKLMLMEFPVTLPVGGEMLLDKPVGEYLALGVHFIPVGLELWVK